MHARHRLRRLRAQRERRGGRGGGRARRRRAQALPQAQALPPVHDAHEMRHLARALKTATSYRLPAPWLAALQVADHWDAGAPHG